MLIDIFDGIETVRCVPIEEAFPDAGDRVWAATELARDGSMFVGGGAAPFFYVAASKEK